MQIKIILFFLLILSLGFHVPSNAFANDGGNIVKVFEREHSPGDRGTFNSLVQVDSDTYALAHAGAKGDGFISTFTISADGSTITLVDKIEHDKFKGSHNSLVQVDSDTYALAYAGPCGSTNQCGYISTFTIDSDGDITPILIQNYAAEGGSANFEHDAVQAMYNSLVKVDSDTFALAYTGADDDGYITSFSIASDGSTITEVAGAILQHDDETGKYNSLVQVDSDTYALAYAGHQSDGYISTFDIDGNGDITPIRVENTAPRGGSPNLEHDQFAAQHNSLVQVDSDTYALAYAGNNQNGYISTFTIDSAGDITPILIQNYVIKGGSPNLEHDTARGQYNSLVPVDSDTFALAYAGDDENGTLSTFTISSDGSSIDEVSSFLHDTPRGIHSSLVQVDSDTFALAYASDARIGYISTFTISQTIIEKIEETKKSDRCYDCEAPKLTKVEVHITSSTSDEIIDDNSPQISETRDYVWTFDQDTPYPMFGDTVTPIIADPGDDVEIILELTDNRTLKRISDSGTYTNFLNRPNDMNLFYANNFDEFGKVSTTFYEWHNTGDDLFYDYSNTVQWSEPDITIQESGEFVKDGTAENLDALVGTFTISFKMKFLEPMNTSDVWVQATDRSGNFFKVSLPLTLKITGNEPLVFESRLNQKVLSFYDEDILSEVVSQWDGSSQNVVELGTILGIPDESLPSWITNLATWVAEDRITIADMIVAIEHIINN